MLYKAPRGTHDLWGKQARKLRRLEDICRGVFRRYNYSEIIVPTFEDAGLFTRSIGETTDIIEKEMYVFEDRKGRKLALRPEGTASIVRAYVENNLGQDAGVSKYFQMGSMFRYDRPQAGRYREFYQVGAEYYGNPAPSADAEMILLARDILRGAGIKDAVILLNTLGCRECRPAYKKALLDYLKPGSERTKDLCEDCAKRMEKNPLRVLDCKTDGIKFDKAPKMENFLCPECKAHFEQVQALLRETGCEYTLDHKLVRGLDYYTRTIFEFRSNALGSQDALGGGGRYDNLIKELGGAETPAVGFAMGVERVIIAADAASPEFGAEKSNIIFVAVASEALNAQAFKLAESLRNCGKDFSVEGPLAGKSLKSQFRTADKIGAEKVVVFGEDEFKRGCVTVRDMKTQSQNEVKINDLIKQFQ
ncbi:MAG: histidine--tRNA ligase [Elusimicrobiota bacterium]